MALIPKKILEKYKNLVAELNQHNHHYYVLDNPSVPDSEYDRQMRKLQEMEVSHPDIATEDSPTQRVGGMALQSFSQKHR